MQGRKLLHGGDYNPEQWLDRPDILAQDIELMKKARVNTDLNTVDCVEFDIVVSDESFYLSW